MNRERWNPGRLLQLSGQYWPTSTLHAAVKVGVFSAIGNEQITSDDIAQKLNGDKKGVTRLLDALAAMNLLEKAGDKYSNTPESRFFLSKDSPEYLGHMIMHHHHLVDSWSRLDQAVKAGTPVRARASYSNDEWRESFLMGMFNLAMMLAPRLVTEIDLSTRRHLLDLGGGPGTYAIHFCLNNPQLKATVYDLPTTRPFNEQNHPCHRYPRQPSRKFIMWLGIKQ